MQSTMGKITMEDSQELVFTLLWLIFSLFCSFHPLATYRGEEDG